MAYILKDKKTGAYSEVENIKKIKKTDLKKFDVLYVAKLDEEIFSEEVKYYNTYELVREQQKIAYKLQQMQQDGQTTSRPIPTIPVGGMNSPVPPNPAPVPPPAPVEDRAPLIDPSQEAAPSKPVSESASSAGGPSPAEVEEAYVKIKEVVERGEFPDVINIDNMGDHFQFNVTVKDPRIPNNVAGIPVVQVEM